jgi:RNA polymerase sigma factor (sigma-70 family)
MSATMATLEPPAANKLLADPSTRRAIEDFVRRRVPGPDVDDVVQTVLLDALAAEGRPESPEELRRWLIGIARHKVADFHRRGAREQVTELPEVAAPPPPIEARELARWAEEQAASTRDAKQTLSWMAREGEGEKLESIAAEERVPAARVRQRVSRMRRWMKERWLAELAAVAALAILALILMRLLRGPKEEPEIAPRPEPAPAPSALPEAPSPLDRARALRAEALEACDKGAWQRCLDGLDEAAGLDPAGDREAAVQDARERAARALEEQRLRDLAPPQKKDDATPKDDKSEKKKSEPLDKPRPITTTTTGPITTPGPTKPPAPTPTSATPTPKGAKSTGKMKPGTGSGSFDSK